MRITSEGCIASDHPALAGHFPENPIVPGVLLLTTILSVIEHRWKMEIGAVTMSAVKFKSPLHPGEPFTMVLESVDAQDFAFLITRGDRTIASGRLRHESRLAAPVLS
jgi:3-hydroxymyristoyl/3-hydroxydecanoyl-(acyl carrier protein) dehydratase